MAQLKKKDWEKDVVYLIQFPRAACLPNWSPFALKLETWLRMAEINYEFLDCGMDAKSNKGQLPFIEMNGNQIADSYFIIEELTKHFQKESIESHLSPMDQANSRAYCALVEQSIFWANYMVLIDHYKELFGDKIMGKHFSSTQKFFKGLYDYRFLEHMKSRCYNQGIGRHSVDEAQYIGMKDLDALVVFLGSKKFMFGAKPTYLDATAFGHICQIWYMPYESNIKTHMKEKCPSLVDYLERIKTTYWSDWDELCVPPPSPEVTQNAEPEEKKDEASKPE